MHSKSYPNEGKTSEMPPKEHLTLNIVHNIHNSYEILKVCGIKTRYESHVKWQASGYQVNYPGYLWICHVMIT